MKTKKKKYSKKLQRCETVSLEYAMREMNMEAHDEPFGLAIYEHKEFYVDIDDWKWFATREERMDYIQQNKLIVIDDLK